MAAQSRGARRERQAKRTLEAEGWVVVRTAGSLGAADLVCLRWDQVPRVVQVKTDVRSPWNNFSPEQRRALTKLAADAGAEAWLLYWPPGKQPKWIAPHTWPKPHDPGRRDAVRGAADGEDGRETGLA